jgi:hypothetical protein
MTGMPEDATLDAPYAAEIDLERERWTEIETICRGLTHEERERHGYYADDGGWSVKDMVGHLGAWMALAETRLLRIEAGNEDHVPEDIDALNAQFLAALHDQPWATVWTQAQSARAQMLRIWVRLPARSADADAWVRKSGAEHHLEHLPRLRAWVAEMRGGAEV